MCVGITSHSARAKGATQEAHLFLIAAFCRLAKSLNDSKQNGMVGRGGGDRTQIPTLGRFRSELTLFIWGLLAFPRQGVFLGHIHTPELRLRIVWVNLLMIPRDYSTALLLSRASVVV